MDNVMAGNHLYQDEFISQDWQYGVSQTGDMQSFGQSNHIQGRIGGLGEIEHSAQQIGLDHMSGSIIHTQNGLEVGVLEPDRFGQEYIGASDASPRELDANFKTEEDHSDGNTT